jgi:ketosteroid isomerase-like protein
MTVLTSHRTSTPPSSTGLSRRSALRGLGGVTVAALLVAGPQADRVMAQAATPSVTEPLFSEWAAAWSGDTARVAVIYAANAVGDDFATGEHFEGADAIRSHIETLHAGIPDLEITLTSGFICENRAALEYVVGGTYSGRPVSFRIAALFELADGKIVREAHYWNPSLPAPGAATPTS